MKAIILFRVSSVLLFALAGHAPAARAEEAHATAPARSKPAERDVPPVIDKALPRAEPRAQKAIDRAFTFLDSDDAFSRRQAQANLLTMLACDPALRPAIVARIQAEKATGKAGGGFERMPADYRRVLERLRRGAERYASAEPTDDNGRRGATKKLIGLLPLVESCVTPSKDSLAELTLAGTSSHLDLIAAKHLPEKGEIGENDLRTAVALLERFRAARERTKATVLVCLGKALAGKATEIAFQAGNRLEMRPGGKSIEFPTYFEITGKVPGETWSFSVVLDTVDQDKRDVLELSIAREKGETNEPVQGIALTAECAAYHAGKGALALPDPATAGPR